MTEEKKKPFRRCAVCKKLFQPIPKMYGICCSDECKKIHKERTKKGMPKNATFRRKLKRKKTCPYCGKEFEYKNAYTNHMKSTMKRIAEGRPGCRNMQKTIADIKDQRLVERRCVVCRKFFVTELSLYRDEIPKMKNESKTERLKRLHRREIMIKPVCSEECKRKFNEYYDRRKYITHTNEEDSIVSSSARDSNCIEKKKDASSLEFKKRETVLII